MELHEVNGGEDENLVAKGFHGEHSKDNVVKESAKNRLAERWLRRLLHQQRKRVRRGRRRKGDKEGEGEEWEEFTDVKVIRR